MPYYDSLWHHNHQKPWLPVIHLVIPRPTSLFRSRDIYIRNQNEKSFRIRYISKNSLKMCFSWFLPKKCWFMVFFDSFFEFSSTYENIFKVLMTYFRGFRGQENRCRCPFFSIYLPSKSQKNIYIESNGTLILSYTV